MNESRKCRRCKCRWPMGHALCPRCGDPTVMTRVAPSESQEYALATLHERFNSHYTDREARRIAAGHIAPEYLGKREAEEILALERTLHIPNARP